KNRGFAMTKAYQVLNDMDSQYPEHFAINARDLLNGEQIDSGKVLVPRKQKILAVLGRILNCEVLLY
ncbi:MAG: hypothetical protein L0I32_07930, partial [Lactobacillus sp.]|nr:hypothetical protein [Lactobacillus sp.]